ncbi:FG-GAP-like repeat-containing protein [Actinocatenispora sera]|uniref:FG-GAP-like repeat-containing protein n=2 Tax=Actinocatenispora sera TaxID=390989 RepID=UPI0004C30083|nr:FG-GAP-like repeat-containing protein [Actinocatenispora sera]
MLTRSRKVFRAFLATGITAVLTATLVSAVPATASASSPTEVATVPADRLTSSAQDAVVFAGATGFAHRRQGVTGVQWTDYATGATRAAPALDDVAAAELHPGGGDDVAVYGTDTGGTVQVGRPDDAALTSHQVPAGFTVMGVGADGTRAVISARSATAPPVTEVLDLTDGSTQPIDGVPDTGYVTASTGTPIQLDGEHDALVPYVSERGGAVEYLLLDLATDTATPIGGLPAQTAFRVTPTEIAWRTAVSGAPAIAVLTQQQIRSGEQTPTVYPIVVDSSYDWALVGDHVVAAVHIGPDGKPTGAVVDIPFDGSGPTSLLASYASTPVQAADGSVLVTGGTDDAHAAVHRFTPGADGGLADATVLALPPVPQANAGLAMAHGNLRHIESNPTMSGGTDLHLYNHGIAPDADPTAAPYGQVDGGTLASTAVRCAPGSQCVRALDGNADGLTYLSADTAGHTTIREDVDTVHGVSRVDLAATGVSLVDVSGGWVLVDSTATGEQYAVRPGYADPLTVGPVTGAALWGTSLWRSTCAGTITQYRLASTGVTTLGAIQTGSACQPDEVQAAQHWLYWSCGGTTAGVYDLTTGASFAVPGGSALLGDGYLVLRTADALQLVDVHTDAAAAPEQVAALPSTTLTDDRGIDWTVDRYSGDIAYVAADDSVHVLASGVPASPLVATSVASGSSISPHQGGASDWNASFSVNHPITGWRFTITRVATGQVVRSVTGGPARSGAYQNWDGHLADGSWAPNGQYRWQFDAVVDGTATPVPGGSGVVTMVCGTSLYRDYSCLGSGAVLAVNTSEDDHASWWVGNSDGMLHNEGGYTETWPLGTTSRTYTMLIPFGDLNGDGYNDLLVRNGTGDVGGYLGGGEAVFNRTTAGHVTIGSGYGGFTAIVSVGDLNDDGIDDLVVRNSAGVLYFKAGTGNSQFVAGVRFTSGWNKYVKLIGVGDVDGDGCGDLMAVDGDGVMWFYRGTKDGRFATKVRVESGWAKYNSIIGVGDITGDAVPDLIARDSAGTIWRYDGSGHATWSVKTQIATGWSNYAMF